MAPPRALSPGRRSVREHGSAGIRALANAVLMANRRNVGLAIGLAGVVWAAAVGLAFVWLAPSWSAGVRTGVAGLVAGAGVALIVLVGLRRLR